MDGPLLDRTQIERIFQIVDTQATAKSRSIDLYVLGSAALVLQSSYRPFARDIDVGLADFYSPKGRDDFYFLHNVIAEISKELGFEQYRKPNNEDDSQNNDLQKTLFDFEAASWLPRLFKTPQKYFDGFSSRDLRSGEEQTHGLNVYLPKKEVQLFLKLTRWNPDTKDYRDMYNLCSDLGISSQDELQRLWDDHKALLSPWDLRANETRRTGRLLKRIEDIYEHATASTVDLPPELPQQRVLAAHLTFP